ncbi:MAG: amidohydrolase family protein [Verrucomicrobia bacterium]|nr:amidohydrolase family protein [Verrucomicrobiota bacterium]
MKTSFRFGIYLKSFGTSIEELEDGGDAQIIKKISTGIAGSQHVGAAIILALDGAVDERGELDLARTEVYVPNEFVERETAKFTNLFFGASINPLRKDALERLRWAKEHGAKLVKWIPSVMLFDPANEAFRPFYEKLVEYQLPLLTHAGEENAFTNARNEFCDPQRLHLPLKIGVTVIVAHIASTGKNEGERDTSRLSRMMGQYTNLFSEISSLTQINKPGYLNEALTGPEWKDRLLYGSDFPLINTLAVSPYYFPLRLTRKQMKEINSIGNPWDRDVLLKQALGVPQNIFRRSAEFFSR